VDTGRSDKLGLLMGLESVPVTFILCLTEFRFARFDPGRGAGALAFVWRLPARTSERCRSENCTKQARVISQLDKQMPEFHTRAMRREFRELMSLVDGVNDQVARFVYRLLSGDQSAAHDGAEGVVDERTQQILQMGDEDLVMDLREINRGRHGVFDLFWEVLGQVLEQGNAHLRSVLFIFRDES
jgi:hypothetical protein